MNIGTGKDYNDYEVNGTIIPCHLIDIAEPSSEFNVFIFREKFFQAFELIRSKNKIPFLAGGTGLYLNSIIKNYDMAKISASPERIEELNSLAEEELKEILLTVNPSVHNTTDLQIKERIIKAILIAESSDLQAPVEKIFSLNIGVHYPRGVIKERITRRLKERLKEGMIDEVENLVKEGITFEKLAYFGLEYKFIGLYLQKELSYNDMFQKLNSAIHAFAKRQMTWYRKMEKEGAIIHWIEGPDITKAKEILNTHYPGA